ncbi:MAG: hypothetical protein RO257_14440 [Candidatus Kapabacteria bacterium]|nr:hypothetical protein [Candidatus Kapabacteria bacterium]
MKTKSVIKQNIDAVIKTNGNIKAVDTNTILKDILDCQELNAVSTGSNVSPFHFFSQGPVTDQSGGQLWYSFKGFKEQFVNFTFVLQIKEANAKGFNFTFSNQAEIFDILNKIGFNRQMDFLVKINNADPKIAQKFRKKFRVGSFSFDINANGFSAMIEGQELDDNLSPGDVIFTSIAFHCPEFKLK